MKKKKLTVFNLINHFLFIVIALIVILPLLIMILSSFKTSMEIAEGRHLALPIKWTLDNYMEVIKSSNVGIAFKNSMILAILSVILNSILSSMVAYTLSRFEFKLKKIYFMLFTLGMLVPSFIAEITRFNLISRLGLYDTLLAPLLIYIATDILQIYVYKQFIDQVPVSLDESARLDGCSYFGVYFRVILPTITPAIATLAILKSVDVLNDMYIPYLYMPSAENVTLTTLLMNYIGRSGSWSKLSAAITIVMLPTIIMFLIFKNRILSGIVAGAVKE